MADKTAELEERIVKALEKLADKHPTTTTYWFRELAREIRNPGSTDRKDKPGS